jgi:endonuclease/exonuclease/phosphatase family metal-dependent hydrolase
LRAGDFNPYFSMVKPDMKRGIIYFLISCCLLAACKSAKQAATGSADQLVVLSYNIHHANPPSQPAGFIDLDTIAATIRSSGAELVAIQELDSVTNRSNREFQLQLLAEKLGMYYRFERTIPFGGGAYGIGILSRYPIMETMAFALPNLEDLETEPRKILLAKLDVKGKSILFGSTHLDFTNAELTLAQARTMLDKLQQYRDYPIIIAGDFNATPEDPAIQLIEASLASSGKTTDYTIPVLEPRKKIDFIFYDSKHFKLVGDSVLRSHNYGSDHLPISATFRLIK